ncbi:MBL fold metallo-hydrolase [Gaetbulibacter sp. M235]|uniref:ComEC/Rec2 family competence protein n=1 Tax=Gaetbulibacter sp. M235 TaxID=3126510 RepID=UPI00374F402C
MISIKFLKAINGDSIFISFLDDKDKTRNILIDGGLDGTYYDPSNNTYGDLRATINSLRKKGEKIDLLVLSHIDNDHINGILRWFENDEKAYEIIEKVWFNSGKLIAQYIKQPENNDLKLNLKAKDYTNTGVVEGLQFENYLLEHKIWDRRIIEQGSFSIMNGLEIRVLSPNKKQLIKLLKEYKEKTKDDAYTIGGAKDWNIDLKILIEEEKESKFNQDSSPKNGSSIALLVTYKENNFLFLADSHPKQIVNALKKLGYTKENPLELELFQISHHGSKANNNKELFEITKTENYVISTNSLTHNHPHKRTLARIISVNPKATFNFNYEYVLDNIFTNNDFKEFTEFKAKPISVYTVE